MFECIIERATVCEQVLYYHAFSWKYSVSRLEAMNKFLENYNVVRFIFIWLKINIVMITMIIRKNHLISISFNYQKKIKHTRKKNNHRNLLFKMLELRLFDLFFHWNVFVVTQRVTYWKMVLLGTGTVPVQMWKVPNPSHDLFKNQPLSK